MTPADHLSHKRTILAVSVPFAIVIVPFLWFGARFDTYTTDALSTRDTTGFAIVAFILLAADILLPIPSSVVATAAGSVLSAGEVCGSAACHAGWKITNGIEIHKKGWVRHFFDSYLGMIPRRPQILVNDPRR